MSRHLPKFVLITAIAAAAGRFAAAPLPARATPADDQYAVAAGHYKLGRWKLAAEEFRRLLDEFPEHAQAKRAIFYLGESLIQLRRFDEAAARFREFLSRAPDDALAPKALFRAGEARYLAGNWPEAEGELERFVTENAQSKLAAYALAYLGDIALKRGDASAAQQWYSRAIELFPNGPLADDCRFGLARSLEAQHIHEQARPLYVALAAKTGGKWADDAQFRLGVSYLSGGQYHEAQEAFQAFDTTFAESEWKGRAQLAFGQALFYLGEYDEAKTRFETLSQNPPLGIETRFWLGLTQKAQRDWNLSAATLLAAATEAPQHRLAPDLRFHAGDALLKSGNLAEAKRQFELVISTWPDSELADDCLLGQAQAALAEGDHGSIDRLAGDFAGRFGDSPVKPALDRVRARSLLTRGQFDKALAVLEPLVSHPPAGVQVQAAPNDEVPGDLLPSDAAEPGAASSAAVIQRCLLAMALQGNQRHEDALAALAQVDGNAAGETLVEILRLEAVSLVALERFDEAATTLERLLRAAPEPGTMAWARGQLAICYAQRERLDQAKQSFASLVEQFPDHEVVPPTALALAQAALAAGDRTWSGELFAFLAADSTPPKYRVDGLSGVAWGLYRDGSLDEAAAAFERLRTGFPTDSRAAEAALLRGQILARRDQSEAALEMFRWVADQHPSSEHLPAALLGAARMHDRLGGHAETVLLYERLDREYPQLPQHDAVVYEWAWSLRALGKLDDAELLFERLRGQQPRGPFWSDAVYRLAERAWQAKDYSRSRLLLTELMDGAPGPDVLPYALYLKAQVEIGSDQWSVAEPHLERLIQEFPAGPLRRMAEHWLAEAAYRQGDFDVAAQRFERLAAQPHERAEPWLAMIPLRRAQVLVQQNQWPEALALAERIEADHPGFDQQHEADYLMGRCLASLGRFDEARQAYRKVIASQRAAKTESAAMAQWMIGESYLHQEDYETALREYLRVDILYDFPTWQAGALLQAGKCYEALGEWKQAEQLYVRLLEAFADTTFAGEARERLREVNGRSRTGG